jgi:hypothetical protein
MNTKPSLFRLFYPKNPEHPIDPLYRKESISNWRDPARRSIQSDFQTATRSNVRANTRRIRTFKNTATAASEITNPHHNPAAPSDVRNPR